jgi:imidazolonepropionase-like amidohydrolase
MHGDLPSEGAYRLSKDARCAWKSTPDDSKGARDALKETVWRAGVFAAVLCAALLSGCVHRPATTLAITHVSIIDPQTGATTPQRTVLVRDRRILRVSADSTVSKDIRTLDGQNGFLIPGLWDMHVHMDSSDLRAFLASGITGVRDMGGDLAELLEWRRATTADPRAGPRLIFAGPLLRGPRSETDSGSSSAVVIRTPQQGRHAVDSLAARGVDFIKVHEGLSREAYDAIAAEARARHLSFVGHTPASLTPMEASDAGQKSIEHFEFIRDPCLYLLGPPERRPATAPSMCSAAALDSLFAHLGRNGTWLDPTIGSFRIFAPAQFPAIVAGFAELVPRLEAHHIRVLAGTDLGTRGIVAGAALHDELELLVQAGFTPLEALQAATSNPAEFLGVTDSLGAIAPGKIADFVLLSADPLRDIRNTRRIVAVVHDGVVVAPR